MKYNYNNLKHSAIPGTEFDYNEFNLNILGLVLQNITGENIKDLLRGHLKSLNMSNSYYKKLGGMLDMSGSLVSSGND